MADDEWDPEAFATAEAERLDEARAIVHRRRYSALATDRCPTCQMRNVDEKPPDLYCCRFPPVDPRKP
jgi:hypothetical protein